MSANGTLVSRGAYTASGSSYGGYQASTPFAWNGRWGCYTDSETGLVLMKARYYAPTLGRFLSRDPIGFAGGINVYAYCGCDPVDMADPSGLAGALPVVGIVFAGYNGVCGALSASDAYVYEHHEDYSSWGHFCANAKGALKSVVNTFNPIAWGMGLADLAEDSGNTWGRYDANCASAGEVAWSSTKLGVGVSATAFGCYGYGKFGSGFLPAGGAPPPELQPFVNGGKTSGILRVATGDIALESGWDGPALSIPRGTSGFDIVTRTHVEGHTAAHMRLNGLTEATVYINNPDICSSCIKLLPRMLPKGSRLTVVTPRGEFSFVGE